MDLKVKDGFMPQAQRSAKSQVTSLVSLLTTTRKFEEEYIINYQDQNNSLEKVIKLVISNS